MRIGGWALCRGRPTRLGDDHIPALADRKQTTANSRLALRQGEAHWKALDFISTHRGTIPFEHMISNHYSHYPLDQVNIAMERMRKYEEIKAVIEP